MNSSITFSKFPTTLTEPKIFTLQREIEQMTQSLEFEKRESTYLDEQIKLIQFEINSLPKPSKLRILDLKAKISVQERKLDLEISSLNNSKFRNRQLRSQIDEYRLDKSAHKQSLNAISENLGKVYKEADQVKENNLKTQENDEEEQEKILKMRVRSASHRSAYDEKMSHLASVLRNSDLNSRFLIEDKTYAAQSIEVISVLKSTSRFSQKYSIDKKRFLDNYLKHINSLKSGFESIKTATGINVIEDMVTSCVKSEEQNLQVLSYLNLLNAEIDLLEESLKSYKNKIRILEGSKNQGKVSVEEIKASNEEHFRNVLQRLSEKQEKNQKISDEVKKSLPLVKQIFLNLMRINLKGLTIKKIDLQVIDKLNQESTSLLLGNIEDFVINLSIVADFRTDHFSSHFKDTAKSSVGFKPAIKELLEEKDLFDEPGFDDIKVPISLEEMKNKAVLHYQNRKSFLRSKPGTPDATLGRNHKRDLAKEQKNVRIQAL
jgi:hypothetical protein